MSLDLQFHFGLTRTRTPQYTRMNALIGSTGFVGSHLIRGGVDVYTSKTIESIRGKTYGTVYCAGIPAEKWKANQKPDEDRDTIDSLKSHLEHMTCSRFVLISTVDVYDGTFPQDEEPDCCPNTYATHPYGVHRREFEVWCKSTFPDVYIFRLPALFGHGLKKNALYDLLHDNQVYKLRTQWSFQWYWLGWLAADIEMHVARGHHLVNLVTPPVHLGLIQTLFFPHRTLSSASDIPVTYKIGSRYGYSHSLEGVLIEMARFVRTSSSRCIVSELAWDPSQDALLLPFLRARGIVDREIVPSKRKWEMSSYANVYSAQSLLYGLDIQIFQEQERFLSILQDRLTLLRGVGCKIIVFGSPRQRIYSGEDAIGLFRRIGALCESSGILFCLEPNAAAYGGNWMTTLRETVDFVSAVNHPAIAVNVDTGSMIMEAEYTIPPGAPIGHIQVSFPGLGAWNSTLVPTVQRILAQVPESYVGRISFETLTPTFEGIESFLSVCSPFQKSL